MKVLMIDDDAELADALRPVMERYGIQLDDALAPSAGLQALRDGDYDAVVLDMMLPEMDGIEVCGRIRASEEDYAGVPILALTARADLTDKVVGLQSGVDDYIAKPFEPRELVARLHAVLRRFRVAPEAETVAASDTPSLRRYGLDDDVIELDLSARAVSVNQEALKLTDVEFRLLRELSAKPGEAISRDDLLDALDYAAAREPRVADVIVYRVRNKLRRAGAKGDFIRTVRGSGYTLVGRELT